jgi:hypothetical protein
MPFGVDTPTRIAVLSKRAFWLVVGATFTASLASASMVYNCDPNIDATVAGTCNALNTTIAGLYNTTFTNANASLYVQYGSTGLASSTQFIINVAYATYANALNTHQGDADDATAVASLGGLVNNPVVSGDFVGMSSALMSTLGIAGGVGITSSLSSCTLGNQGCYNGIITVSNTPGTFYYRSGTQGGSTYDIFSAIEHETDEMLGTISFITGPGTESCPNGNGGAATAAADLFRYSAPGTRSFTATANGTPAYFSINGGTTNIANYNNSNNSADYGDWDSAALRVQNAFGTPGVHGTDITNDGGSEIAVLDAVGYNLRSAVATPEPGTIGMFSIAFVAFGLYRCRKRSS